MFGGGKKEQKYVGIYMSVGHVHLSASQTLQSHDIDWKKKHIKIKNPRMNVLCSAVVTVAIVHVGGWEVNKKVSSIARKFRVNGEINLI